MPAEARKPVETVEVKKRRLRTALRRARDDAGVTQRSVAESLDWSVSKVVRIEQGTVPVSPSDVRILLSLYSVNDESRVTELVNLSRESRERKGESWDAYNDVYTREALDLFGSERAAKVIYKYEPTLVPGLFQTYDYARAILRALGNSDDHVKRKLEVRLERQQLLDADVRPDLNFILGEAAISRPVGGRGVMLEQIEALRKLAERPGINIHVLPFSAGPYPAMGSAFTVLQFEDPDLSDLLYLESPQRETVVRDDEDEIGRYLDLFVQLQDMAEKSGGLEATLDEIVNYRFRNGNPT
jgi:transcriptional regulator with XRE-family HTH domain